MSDTKKADITVALIGNPNTGKSTFFSALCGVPTRIGNYPGVTVEKKLGSYSDTQGRVTVIDLPGTYSLTARTLDEKVSVDVLLGKVPDVLHIDLIIAVIDACNLERNLYLFTQLRQLGIPLLAVLNFWDRAQSEVELDICALETRLGCKVVTTAAHRSEGIAQARAAIRHAAAQPPSEPPDYFPAEFQSEANRLREWLTVHGQSLPDFSVQRLIMDLGGAHAEELKRASNLNGLSDFLVGCRERLAASGHRVPALETKSRYDWIRRQLTGIYRRLDTGQVTTSDKIDRYLTHRYSGFAFFGLLMFIVYQAITRGADIFASQIDSRLIPWVSSTVEQMMSPGVLRSLITDGVIAGVGAVIVFLPIIVLLFFFIALLEDCGYMARAAFVMDKIMSRLGLSGKSFLPLMSSFACAVPGIMATRVIENWRDRMVTILIAPLMSCSARLPVYMLLITAFVPEKGWLGGWIGLQGIVLFAMSSLGLLVAIPVAWILKRVWFKGEPSAFVMELPSYKLPSLRVVFFRVWERAIAFLSRAGTLIFCTTVLVWTAGYFPGDHTRFHELTERIEAWQGDQESAEFVQLRDQHRQLAGELIEQSWLGRFGKLIEPAVRPLGWDWRIGVGVVASFPAREVIIATLGTIYSLGGDSNEDDPGLHAALHSSRWPDGRPVFNVPVAFSIMVFFALCAQCAATLMVIRRETNSWFWPVFTFVYMTALAYVAALLTFNIAGLFVST